MAGARQQLAGLLEEYYRGCGWSVTRAEDGTVRARGLGGVTWIGLPVVGDDLADPAFSEALRTLSEERMPTGELCPLELLPDAGCADELRGLLAELRLSDRGHVGVYSLAA
jgi:hypothetical protein